MNNFTEFNLHSNIYKAITVCGYTKPTPVQAKSIPEVMNGRDVVVSAQTGTGKTASFVLPALHSLSLQPPTKKTRILILTPTRELASQITKAAGMYGKYLKFNIVNLVGGMPYHHQIRDLARGADIIVATPGRLLDHIEQKRVDLSNVEMLVLDEADRMLDMGFIEDVQYIAKLTPGKRQTLLFSATLDNKLMNAVKHLLKNPVRIDLSSEKITAPQIKQEMYKANNSQHKTRLLKHFLNDTSIYKAIIFSATKINADKLANHLRDEGFAAAALHGDLRQNVRNRTLEQLRNGKIQFLVATDVAARGIDVSDITHVINYDLPRFCEDYVHRIGRTGRAGKAGIAISFVLPTDTRHVHAIERYTGQRIKLIHNVDIKDTAPSRSAPEQEILTLKKDYKAMDDRKDRKPKKQKDQYWEKSYSKKSIRNDKSDRFESKSDNYSKRNGNKDRNEFGDDYRGAKKDRYDFGDDYRGVKRERNHFGDDSRADKKGRSEFSDGFRPKKDKKEFSNDFRSKNDFRAKKDKKDFGDDFRAKRDRKEFSDDFRPKKDRNEFSDGFNKDFRRPKKRDATNKVAFSDNYRPEKRDKQSSGKFQSEHRRSEKKGDRDQSQFKDDFRPKKKFSSFKKDAQNSFENRSRGPRENDNRRSKFAKDKFKRKAK